MYLGVFSSAHILLYKPSYFYFIYFLGDLSCLASKTRRMPDSLTGSDPMSVSRHCDGHISYLWKDMTLAASGGGKPSVLADYYLAANGAVPPLVSLFIGQTLWTAPEVARKDLGLESILDIRGWSTICIAGFEGMGGAIAYGRWQMADGKCKTQPGGRAGPSASSYTLIQPPRRCETRHWEYSDYFLDHRVHEFNLKAD